MPQSAQKHQPSGSAFVKAQRQKIAEAKRAGLVHRKLYNKEVYKRFRLAFLREHPLCKDCKIAPSVDVHHVRKLAVHPEDLCDGDHCVGLCSECHDIRTGKGE